MQTDYGQRDYTSAALALWLRNAIDGHGGGSESGLANDILASVKTAWPLIQSGQEASFTVELGGDVFTVTVHKDSTPEPETAAYGKQEKHLRRTLAELEQEQRDLRIVQDTDDRQAQRIGREMETRRARLVAIADTIRGIRRLLPEQENPS